MYRDGKKGMYILLSNSCLVLPAVVKQQQEEIFRNHVPSLYKTPLNFSPYLENMLSYIISCSHAPLVLLFIFPFVLSGLDISYVDVSQK